MTIISNTMEKTIDLFCQNPNLLLLVWFLGFLLILECFFVGVAFLLDR